MDGVSIVWFEFGIYLQPPDASTGLPITTMDPRRLGESASRNMPRPSAFATTPRADDDAMSCQHYSHGSLSRS